jgi:hypothetical protein
VSQQQRQQWAGGEAAEESQKNPRCQSRHDFGASWTGWGGGFNCLWKAASRTGPQFGSLHGGRIAGAMLWFGTARGPLRVLAIFTFLASIWCAWLYPNGAMFDYEKHIH